MRRFFSWLWRRWRSPKWTTRDNRRIRVADMSDSHLRNCLAAIKEGRLFPTDDDLLGYAADTPAGKFLVGYNNVQLTLRERWRERFADEMAARGIAV
jgi:hypothetical protein